MRRKSRLWKTSWEIWRFRFLLLLVSMSMSWSWKWSKLRIWKKICLRLRNSCLNIKNLLITKWIISLLNFWRRNNCWIRNWSSWLWTSRERKRIWWSCSRKKRLLRILWLGRKSCGRLLRMIWLLRGVRLMRNWMSRERIIRNCRMISCRIRLIMRNLLLCLLNRMNFSVKRLRSWKNNLIYLVRDMKKELDLRNRSGKSNSTINLEKFRKKNKLLKRNTMFLRKTIKKEILTNPKRFPDSKKKKPLSKKNFLTLLKN